MTASAPDPARIKERAALWSIAASAAITLAKGAAGLATGSLALISDALHSLADVAATAMTWAAIRIAARPADESHPYGHGKVESLAALAETAFLFGLSGVVAWEGMRRLVQGGAEVEPSWMAAGVLVAAIAVDAWRWRGLTRAARETGSEALAADALHFSSDLVNSALVLAALGAAALGYPQVDALVAVGVALFIGVAGFRLARRTLDTLLDAAPSGLAEQVRRIAEGVPGIVGVGRVRVRPAGGHVIGEIAVQVARTLPLDRVEAIRARLVEAVRGTLPGAEFTVTAEPVPLDNETVLERVMLIAAKRRLPVHHVTAQEVAGRLTLSLDIEVDGRLSLRAAHAQASRLEQAIRDEFGAETEVDTHIEPLRVRPIEGQDEPEAVARIGAALGGAARRAGLVGDVHKVRVRRSAEGLVVNYHCRVDPDLTVAEVHDAVDAVEQIVRGAHPEILRLTGHAEPARREAALPG